MAANNLACKPDDPLLVEAFRGYSEADLLRFYQHKPAHGFSPLSKGKAKYVPLAEDILNNRFNLNNEIHQLPLNFDWRHNPSADLEWLILLHKFYYLKDLAYAYDVTQNEIFARKWVDLIDSWIHQDVPAGFINSQVTGRRLQQWLISYRYFVGKWKTSCILPVFFARFLHSVNSQTHYLCENLTPEGNHRTLELYAIFMVAVTFPELAASNYFLEFSKIQLLENIKKDLLPDGVHRELSTDYHHTVLKNYLRFRELAGFNHIAFPAEADALLRQALEFSCHVHKPDGFIPAINDGDCNSYLPLLNKACALYGNEHFHYVASQGITGSQPAHRARLFAHSGYTILRSAWAYRPYTEAFYLFFDCARLGFGSHGHYDALNFEAAAYGHPLIIDPGRYTYCETSDGDGVNWRRYFKGTAAHNTVVVDGLDQIAYQCECPVDPEPEPHLDFFISHTGFDWVQGRVSSHRYPVVHERSIFFLLDEYWIVTDRLLTDSRHDYDLYFHLPARAQDRVTENHDDACFSIDSPNLLVVQPRQAVNTKLTIEQGYVSPEYGIKFPAPVLKYSQTQQAKACFTSLLYPYKDAAPSIKIRRLPVYCNDVLLTFTEATALSIELTNDQGVFRDLFFVNHRGDDQTHVFADVSVKSRLLFIRLNADNQIVNLQAEALQAVSMAGNDLLKNLDNGARISYRHGNFAMSGNKANRSMQISGLTNFPSWQDVVGFWRRHGGNPN